jgi:hypothetical protein
MSLSLLLSSVASSFDSPSLLNKPGTSPADSKQFSTSSTPAHIGGSISDSNRHQYKGYNTVVDKPGTSTAGS